MARMAASETNLGTGRRGKDRKKSPEEIAEERIEAARKSKATELDLWGLSLTELPASVCQLMQLERLNAGANQLTGLPEGLSRLTQLKHLDVSNNQLTALPEDLCEIACLEELDASLNNLLALPESLGHLARLRFLNLSDCWLDPITRVLASPGGESETYNDLAALPESLRRLRKLEQLYLHGNRALRLPPEVLGPTWEDVISKGANPANPASILDYYFKMYGGRRPLNEVRLLLVGRGAAGKTSIVRRLIENKFRPREKETGVRQRSEKKAQGSDFS